MNRFCVAAPTILLFASCSCPVSTSAKAQGGHPTTNGAHCVSFAERKGFKLGMTKEDALSQLKVAVPRDEVQAVKPTAQPGADGVPWGEPADGLQCRLTPAVQELVVQPGDDPRKRAVELLFQMRNVGDRAIRVDPMDSPLAHWMGGLAWVDPSGKPDHRSIALPEGDPPRADRAVTILPGQTVESRVVATDCFHRHGTYQVSFNDRGSKWRDLNPGPRTTLASNTVRVRTVPARDMPWGESVEGVQVRLRAERPAWPFNEPPVFNVDMRNEGRRRLGVHQTEGFFRFEVDGQWYDWPRKPGAHERPLPFGPDRRYDDVRVRLWGTWYFAKDRRQLWLRAGKHAIRIAFTAGPAEDDKGGPVTVVSNPVEITVERGAPGTGLPLADAFSGEFDGVASQFAFVAVCRALDTPTVGSGVRAMIEQPQKMAVIEVLAGKPPRARRISLSYSCMSGSPVEKGERLIWIVHRRHDGAWLGTKALADTPENRKAVIDSAQERLGRSGRGGT